MNSCAQGRNTQPTVSLSTTSPTAKIATILKWIEPDDHPCWHLTTTMGEIDAKTCALVAWVTKYEVKIFNSTKTTMPGIFNSENNEIYILYVGRYMYVFAHGICKIWK